MKRVKARGWHDLDALPEGEWVEVEGGLHIEVEYAAGARPAARVVVPLDPKVARALKPGAGEVLEATVRGRNVELVRRRTRRKDREDLSVLPTFRGRGTDGRDHDRILGKARRRDLQK